MAAHDEDAMSVTQRSERTYFGICSPRSSGHWPIYELAETRDLPALDGEDACANRDDLQLWESKLNELGVARGGIVDASYGSGLSFRDPDNIALEFFAPPS